MNKICTDINQSQKFIELGIDIDTADMYWWSTSKRSYIEAMDDGDFNEAEGHVPAWSLSALLELIPNYVINKADDKIYANLYYGFKSSHDNLIDAAFEMVCLLKENNKL